MYVWWQHYRERGEAAFVATQAFQSPPEIDRPHNAQEQNAHSASCHIDFLPFLIRLASSAVEDAWPPDMLRGVVLDPPYLLLANRSREEDLNAPHRFAWTETWPGYSLIAVIADNSYEHYHDHAQQIRRWLDAPKAQPYRQSLWQLSSLHF